MMGSNQRTPLCEVLSSATVPKTRFAAAGEEHDLERKEIVEMVGAPGLYRG
jgi:hypothetical protein